MTVSAVPPDVVAAAAAAAKAWMRAGGGDDATVAMLATSAIVLAEAFCGQVLIARSASETVVPGTRWQPLAAAPVTAIDGVAAVAADGDGTAPLAPDRYAIDIDADGTGWIRLIQAADAGRVTVGYRVGTAATWDQLPPPIAQGIAMLVAHLFDHRDGGEAPPAAVAALWRPWRRLALAERRHA